MSYETSFAAQPARRSVQVLAAGSLLAGLSPLMGQAGGEHGGGPGAGMEEMFKMLWGHDAAEVHQSADGRSSDPNQINLDRAKRGGIFWYFDRFENYAFAWLIPDHKEAGLVGSITAA